MAIVDRFTSARGFAAQCSTRHDTIEPAPQDGTHASSAERHDEHVSNSGASSLSQRSQRRIIRVGSARPASSSMHRARFGSNWYMRASV
jgi:hypothetical protein